MLGDFKEGFDGFTFLAGGNTACVDSRPRLLSTTDDIRNFDFVFAFDVGHAVHLLVEVSESLHPPTAITEVEVLAEDLIHQDQVGQASLGCG